MVKLSFPALLYCHHAPSKHWAMTILHGALKAHLVPWVLCSSLICPKRQLVLPAPCKQKDASPPYLFNQYFIVAAKIGWAFLPTYLLSTQCAISLPKPGSKSDPHPRPPDLHQNVPNICANTPGKLLAPEGSYWESTFWQGFPPCPPGHLPPQTEYAGVLGYI